MWDLCKCHENIVAIFLGSLQNIVNINKCHENIVPIFVGSLQNIINLITRKDRCKITENFMKNIDAMFVGSLQNIVYTLIKEKKYIGSLKMSRVV